MLRDPRRDDHTICTAVAPDFVFAVRTYGTRPPCDPVRGHAGESGRPPASPGKQPPSHSHDQGRNNPTRQNSTPARDPGLVRKSA